jgi:hypothetical protein
MDAGFTLVELLIIAPVVIIVISGFIALIITMVGDVLAIRDRNNMAFEIRNTLDRIEQDTRLSTQFLTTSNTLLSPQGSDSNFTGTAAFNNTNSLILGTLTTDKNPTDTTRQLVFYAKQPNDCGAQQGYNRPFISKTMYFIKNGSLWRRSYLFNWNQNATPNDETLCSAPWQQNSCSPGYTAPRCQTNDVEMMQNVSSFNIKYYATPQSTTDIGATNALSATSIEVTINGQKTIAGRSVTNAGTVRVAKINNIDADLAAPTTPTVSGQVSGPNTITFSWPTVPSATSYNISYNINGGSWVNATNDSTATSFSVNAYRNDTVTIQVSAHNSTGTSAVDQEAATLPAWNSCTLAGTWQNYQSGYATAGYTKTNNEVVYLKGLVKNGNAALGQVICNLPVGYRPTARLVFLSSSNGTTNGIAEGAPVRIDVATNGDVIIDYGGNSAWIDLDMIRFIPSGSPYTWNSIGLYNGWQNYENIVNGYSTMQYAVDSTGRVQLQGLLKNGTYTDWTVAGKVPTPQRVTQFMNWPAASNTAFNNFGLANGGTTGDITARGLNGSGYWSIQGRYYPYTFNSWTNLPLTSGWIAFDAANYSPPTYTKSADGIVTVRGLIKNGAYSTGSLIATLPPGYRPAERQIYTCTANGSWSRVDVLPNGDMQIRAAYNGWISLDSITFIAEQ